MTDALGSRSQRHAAIVTYLMAIPIEDIRDMLKQPGDLEDRLREHVPDFSLGEFVAALKEVADRQQHEADDLLAEAERLSARR
ncbi:hypothetical protein [Aureimonas leprariae]|uniref:Uncharacterized protein n=1 Tax=Plantimonas leprariae TaxID=2615207 RepID=A0A7V7PME9_9HYPH|nr:hypothetical protein [Aureimonas leprariae]KAB0678066.1 hypothetical protein F6X38_16705 [Aureimonas leprariae]